jgi:hypothetical protein
VGREVRDIIATKEYFHERVDLYIRAFGAPLTAGQSGHITALVIELSVRVCDIP